MTEEVISYPQAPRVLHETRGLTQRDPDLHGTQSPLAFTSLPPSTPPLRVAPSLSPRRGPALGSCSWHSSCFGACAAPHLDSGRYTGRQSPGQLCPSPWQDGGFWGGDLWGSLSNLWAVWVGHLLLPPSWSVLATGAKRMLLTRHAQGGLCQPRTLRDIKSWHSIV